MMTLPLVIDELAEEGHEPLRALALAVASRDSLRDLDADTSHLRLVLRSPAQPRLRLLVGLDSIDRGGRRSDLVAEPTFEVAAFNENEAPDEPSLRELARGVESTVALIERMLHTDLT